MGNCIGKKPFTSGKNYPSTHSSLISYPSKKLPSENRRIRQSIPTVLLPSCPSKSSSNEKTNERKVIQYSSPLHSTGLTSPSNEQLLLLPSHSTVSSNQLSSEYKICHSSNTLINSTSENHIKQPFEYSINEKDTTMGQFFSKESEMNKENVRHYEEERVHSIDIKVHCIDNDHIEPNEQYLTIINDQQMSSTSTMVKTHERRQESLNTSPTSSLFDASLSSLSCNTTPFSSQDRLILSSSPSSSSSVVLSPISSSTIVSLAQTSRSTKIQSQAIYSHGSRSLSYAEQIYFHQVRSADLFKAVLPISSSSRHHHDPLINEFHQNIRSNLCRTLKTVIDNVLQQEFLRVHRSSQVILVEHDQFDCARLKDVKKSNVPSLIFDEQERRVYLSKHARTLGLQSITSLTSEVTRLPKLFASCDHCSSILSGWKLNQWLHPFFLVNITHHLVEECFNESNQNSIFGYVSREHPTKIRQIMINNGKLAYSYDLDLSQTTFYFVLRLRSWPDELRQAFLNRTRQWPSETERLFDGTCFIRLDQIEEEVPLNKKCLTCEKSLSSAPKSFWSYTFAAMENELISLMSDEQIRFASILWNYFNAKTNGQLPFTLFKHTLFYFFEEYPSDTYLTSDLISHAHLFTDFLLHRLHQKCIPHYFNGTFNLYQENLAIDLFQSLSMKMTYLDLKHFPIYLLPKSSLFLYHLIYLIQLQRSFFQCLLDCTTSKTNSIQTILDTHELVLKQFSSGIRLYKRQLETITSIKRLRPLTLDCLYAYQEQNVQIILDYLPLLRDREPSLLVHSLWSMFIQYFNCLFDDLFLSEKKRRSE